MTKKANQIVFITLAVILLLLLAALFVQAGERGKWTGRGAFYATNYQSIPVGDVEGHIVFVINKASIRLLLNQNLLTHHSNSFLCFSKSFFVEFSNCLTSSLAKTAFNRSLISLVLSKAIITS